MQVRAWFLGKYTGLSGKIRGVRVGPRSEGGAVMDHLGLKRAGKLVQVRGSGSRGFCWVFLRGLRRRFRGGEGRLMKHHGERGAG